MLCTQYYMQKEGTQPEIPSLKSPHTKKVKGVFFPSFLKNFYLAFEIKMSIKNVENNFS